MGKKKERKLKGSGKRKKHSMDANRKNGESSSFTRSAATVRRLKMYKSKPYRNRKGKILKQEFQSKNLPNTRIQPDQRWFGNIHVISQKQLELLRDEYQRKMKNSYHVILNPK